MAEPIWKMQADYYDAHRRDPFPYAAKVEYSLHSQSADYFASPRIINEHLPLAGSVTYADSAT
jgi:hypothetical protein